MILDAKIFPFFIDYVFMHTLTPFLINGSTTGGTGIGDDNLCRGSQIGIYPAWISIFGDFSLFF